VPAPAESLERGPNYATIHEAVLSVRASAHHDRAGAGDKLNNQNRSWLITVLGFLPDATVGFVVSYLTDTGWKGFFWTIAALWGVAIFMWLKNLPWRYLGHRLGRAERIRSTAKNFAKQGFPRPETYDDTDLYLPEVKDNETLPAETRIAAAESLAMLSGMRVVGQGLAAAWVEGTLNRAIKEYSVNYRSIMKEARAEAHEDDAKKLVRLAMTLK
jgi:hypothetical protein